MKILMINSVCGIRSTGRICTDLASELESQGHQVKIAYGREEVPERFQKYAVRIGTNFSVCMHAIATRLFDCHGFASKHSTKKFLKWAEMYNPDMLWLHNIHGYYLNVDMLFQWIKSRPNMEVKWTLHDCWAFTGHCAHFTAAGCEKWITQCVQCDEIRRYPVSIVRDNCSRNYLRKKGLFTGVKNMALITPSQWLADIVKQSFLKEYKVEVRYNKIDTTIFKPTYSDFRKKHNLENQKVVLGVASTWGARKGIEDFLQLSKMLDESYSIVLVGLNEREFEKHGKVASYDFHRQEISGEVRQLPGGLAIHPNVMDLYQTITGERYRIKPNMTAKVVCIPATNSPKELAEIYTAADVFVNPTHEDNYPTVNLEARACGTNVITYDIGGSAETLL